MIRRTTVLVMGLLVAGAVQGAAGRTDRYLRRGDAYLEGYQFDLAAQSYKMALMVDPQNPVAWERHRQAVERGRVIERYVAKAQELKQQGRIEEASQYLQQAVKMNPRSREIWTLYEQTLVQNPSVYMVQSEEEAWDAYREAKARYEEGDYHSARRLLDEVYANTDDKILKYYAKSYLQKVQLKVKEQRPSNRIVVADK